MQKHFFLFFLLLLRPPVFSGQNLDSLCLQQKLVLNTLKRQHYSPPEFNSTTYKQVLNIFIKEADERNIIILSPDKNALLKIIDSTPEDEVPCELLKETYCLFKRRLPQLDSIIDKIELSKFEFTN